MIPLAAQVAPLAQSQRLQALGMPQDTLFAWVKWNGGEPYVTARDGPYVGYEAVLLCAAPTVAEMMVLMPDALFGGSDHVAFIADALIAAAESGAMGWSVTP